MRSTKLYGFFTDYYRNKFAFEKARIVETITVKAMNNRIDFDNGIVLFSDFQLSFEIHS